MKLYIVKPDTTKIALDQSDQVIVKKTLNKDDYIVFKTISSTVLDIPVGSFIFCDTASSGATVKYTLNKIPDISKVSDTEFQYTYTFESPMYDLKKSIFKVLGKTDDFFIGNAEQWLDQIISSLAVDGYTFTKGTVDVTDDKNLPFVGDTCWSMLNRICEEFDLEFIFDYFEISLTYKVFNDRGLSFSQGIGNGIVSITEEKSNAVDLVTRLYYEGGTQNLGSTYGFKRLQGSSAYVSNNESLYGVHAAVKYFDDIYPTYTGTVGVVSYDTNNIPSFIDLATPFDINDNLIPNVIPSITMLDGDCAGYSFQIEKYDNATKKFTLIQYESQNGLKIPTSSGLNIANGDTFKITEISLPSAYLTAAISELDAAATTEIAEISSQPKTFNVDFESDYLDTIYLTNEVLDVGDGVGLTDTYLNPPTQLRVIEIEYDLFYKSRCSAKLSETRFALPGRTQQIKISIAEKAAYKNRLFDVTKIQKSEKTTAEVYGKTYESYDGRFRSTNIRTENIDPYHLALDSGEPQFVVNSRISTVSPTSLKISAGTFKIRNYNALNRDEIEAQGGSYNPVQSWTIAETTVSKLSGIGQYIYAKVDNTKNLSGGLIGTEATVVVSEEVLSNKYTEDNYLYYMLGTVDENDSLSMLWSNTDDIPTPVNNKLSKSGKIHLTQGTHFITFSNSFTDSAGDTTSDYSAFAKGKIDGEIRDISIPTITPYQTTGFSVYVSKECDVYWSAILHNN